MREDLKNTHQIGQSIDPDLYTATVTGNGVDFQDCGPEVLAILNVGDFTGTSPTLDVTLEESDDDSTYTAVESDNQEDNAFAQMDGDEDNTVTLLQSFTRSKRYVRAVGTIGGTTANIDMCVTLMARKTSYETE